MKLKLPLNQHEIPKLCFLSIFFFKFLNGYSHYYDGQMLQRLYGWPLIYYYDPGVVSGEFTLYIFPMIFNIIMYILTSFIIIKLISFVFKFFNIDRYLNDKFFYFFSSFFLLSSLLYFFIVIYEVTLCCGPRGEIEIADQFKFWY